MGAVMRIVPGTYISTSQGRDTERLSGGIYGVS